MRGGSSFAGGGEEVRGGGKKIPWICPSFPRKRGLYSTRRRGGESREGNLKEKTRKRKGGAHERFNKSNKEKGGDPSQHNKGEPSFSYLF